MNDEARELAEIGELPETVSPDLFPAEKTAAKAELLSANSIALNDCERRFQEGLREQTVALDEIKRRELYRVAGYTDFFDYARERLDVGRNRAYQLLFMAETLTLLANSRPELADMITNERQIRPLTGMRPESCMRVLDAASKMAAQDGTRLTGKLVTTIARDRFNWKPRTEFKKDLAAKRLAEQSEGERAARKIADFGRFAVGIADLYPSPEQMVEECGSAKRWYHFEELCDWIARVREIS